MSKSYKVRTQKELGALLDDERFATSEKIQFVEVIMERMDAPQNMKMQAKMAAKTNMYAESTASTEKMKSVSMSFST
jgi:pyruvate decarboxylase